MSSSSGKIIISTALTLSAALVIAGASAGIIYWNGIRKNTPVEKYAGVSLKPEKNKYLGGDITASAMFKCPWHRWPVEAEITPGKGTQAVDSPSISLYRIRPGYCIWKVSAVIQPFRTGDIPAGSLTVKFNRDSVASRTPANLTEPVPSFKVSPLPPDKSPELILASRIEKKNNTGNIILLALLGTGIMVVTAVILVIMMKKQKTGLKIIMTPWEQAFADLTILRNQLKEGKIPSATCFSKLTDIVRGYLEKRFSLHAPRQTTYEFLKDLNNSGGILAENHRKFLKEFMTSADLVKFANLPADTGLLENAMNKARELVTETKPAENTPAPKEEK
jgi:hypothetical protein